MRGRLDVGGGHLADPRYRTEDDIQLPGEQVQLVVGDGQPGQSGQMRDLVARNAGCTLGLTHPTILWSARTPVTGASHQ